MIVSNSRVTIQCLNRVQNNFQIFIFGTIYFTYLNSQPYYCNGCVAFRCFCMFKSRRRVGESTNCTDFINLKIMELNRFWFNITRYNLTQENKTSTVRKWLTMFLWKMKIIMALGYRFVIGVQFVATLSSLLNWDIFLCFEKDIVCSPTKLTCFKTWISE